MKRALVLGLTLAVALFTAGCGRADDAFGNRVRAYLLEHPEVIEEAVQKLQEKRLAEAAEVARAGLAKHREALERDPRDFVANPDGKITVVEFFDYRCGYCKVTAPEILQIIEENPDVRFVFKEFPIFGGVSDLAARVALSPQAKPKTLELYRRFMAEKSLDEAAIDRHLRAIGVDPAAAKAGGSTPEIDKQIADVRALAQALAIEGTPAFVVGDRMIPGADIPALRAAIAQAKGGELKAAPNPDLS
ncbi:MAG: DsbA family protein [Phenylobacterium sp.]|uniref:DsbA family protein n=1 Tax=Phenylobacterium sp. TaxID=1871053 RepID=UPI00391C61AA